MKFIQKTFLLSGYKSLEALNSAVEDHVNALMATHDIEVIPSFAADALLVPVNQPRMDRNSNVPLIGEGQQAVQLQQIQAYCVTCNAFPLEDDGANEDIPAKDAPKTEPVLA